MSPIELLQQELDKLIRARKRSIDAFKEGKIDINLHEQHIHNLTPMIEEYKYTIRVLETYI